MNDPRTVDDAVGRVPRSTLGRLMCAARARYAPRELDRQLAEGREREALLGLAARLRAEELVELAAVAQLAVLVWDVKSPVYGGGRPVEQVAAVVGRCVRTAGDDFCALP